MQKKKLVFRFSFFFADTRTKRLHLNCLVCSVGDGLELMRCAEDISWPIVRFVLLESHHHRQGNKFYVPGINGVWRRFLLFCMPKKVRSVWEESHFPWSGNFKLFLGNNRLIFCRLVLLHNKINFTFDATDNVGGSKRGWSMKMSHYKIDGQRRFYVSSGYVGATTYRTGH